MKTTTNNNTTKNNSKEEKIMEATTKSIINVTVNGADNPEEWGRRMASELRRQVKMA